MAARFRYSQSFSDAEMN